MEIGTTLDNEFDYLLVEKNMISLFKLLMSVSLGEFVEKNEITYANSESIDWPKGIVLTNITSKINNKIDEIIELIKNNNVPKYWSVGPLSKPASLLARLMDKGFVKINTGVGMMINLEDLDIKIKLPEGFTIVKVENNLEDVKEWSTCASQIFEEKEYGIDKVLKLLKDERIRLYICKKNDKAVGTSMLFNSNEIGGIYYLGILDEYRGLGIGTMLCMHSLMEAHQLGLQFGGLVASTMGYKVYKKIGFSEGFKLYDLEYKE